MHATTTGPVRSTRRWALASNVLRLAPVILLAAALVLPSAVSAQVLYGSMTGTVVDATGAIVPGVTVQAVNVATRVTKEAVTNDRGAFNFSNLTPGVYEVTFQISGFKTVVEKEVQIVSNAIRRVDAKLEVSGVAENVQVVAEAVPLQTDRGDVHVTQTAQQVNDLPLAGSLGRNYQTLMQIVPGSVIMRTEAGNGEANSTAGSPQRSISFSANGVSGWQNQTRIDGSPVQYVWLPTNTAYVPSPEAIEEVSIVTNSYTPDVGMAAGAAVNVVVKTGTNRLKGTGWAYDNDSSWRARNPFLTTPMTPKDLVWQYGGNVGGPVMKDKLFFFFNAERTTQRTAQGGALKSIAPESLRPNAAGDVVFPMPGAPGGGAIIYDPTSNADPSLRTPFPNNTIPASRIDQAALYLIKRLPATTSAGYINNVNTTGNYFYNRTNYDLKLNYAGRKFSVFGRYGNSPHYINDAYALGEAGGGSASGGSVGVGDGRTQVLGIGATYLFNSTLMLDANFGLTHQVLGSIAPDIDTTPGSDPDKMNIPGTNGPDRMQGGLPSFQLGVLGQTGYWSNLGNDGTGNPFQFRDNQYSYSASLQKQFSAHLVRGGFELLDQQINHFQPQGGNFQTVRGTFIFNGQSTMLQNAGAPADARFNSWASFLLGLPSNAGKVEQLVNPNSIYMKTFSFYIGDSWRASNNLTITPGLRWEEQYWPTRPDGTGINRFDPTTGYVLVGGYGSTPQNTGATTSGNFLPRIGAAYRLNDKTVVRGGYARSVDNSSFINFRNSYPSVYIWSLPVAQYNGVDNPYVPVTTLRKGISPPAGSPDYSSGKILLPAGTSTTTYPQDMTRGAVDSFNVTVQREVTPWLTAQAAYVATRAHDAMAYVNINAGAPGTGTAGRALYAAGLTNANTDINSYQPYGDLSYNGLQTLVKIRVKNGQVGGTYTLSKTMDYVDNGGGNAAGAGGPRIQYLPDKELNWGLAGYDRRHNFQGFWNYDLPFGKSQPWANSGWSAAVFGDWQLNGALALMSGTPIYIVQNSGFNLNAQGSNQIPDLVKATVATYPDNLKGKPLAGADPNSYQYFDRSAYQVVNIPAGQPQRFGNAPKNIVRGPGYAELDLGLFRTFNLPRAARMQLRIEALNALNHANYANPSGNISDAANFGFITATTGIGERRFRLGMRIWF